ncbi:MAG TPA: amidohydrolase family protein [Candidatus Binatia bacterium]|jgi:aminocarboxymuconate-semialdehyde decarboxylase|nr:amidohydrolase family protein [Candidatus Binatia bacterium]
MGKDSSTVSRRDFLKFTGKTAAVSAAFLSGCAQTSLQSAGRSAGGPARAIDIHHHYFAPELVNEIKQHGNALGIEYYTPKDSRESPLSIQFPKGNRLNLDPRLAEIEKRLEIMNQGSIAIATVEVQTSAVGYELDGSRGESWSKLYNEAIQSLVKRHPNRFAGIATVPLQDPSRAAKVLEYAIVNLKMSGVTIASNVVGKYYDSKDFDPFWKKAEELDVMMIMHPEWVAGSDKMGGYGLRTVCGNPADTTLSVGYMIYSGVFDRFPKLKLALLHGGGFFPYHLGRFDRGLNSGSGAGPSRIAASQPPSKYLKNLYFDNLVYRVETVEYLKRMVGTEHVMVGTDYPYDLGDWMAAEKIQQMNCTDAERDAMLHGNARNLLRIPADQQA